MDYKQEAFIEACELEHGPNAVLTRQQIQEVCDKTGVPFPFWILNDPAFKSGRGKFKIPTLEAEEEQQVEEETFVATNEVDEEPLEDVVDDIPEGKAIPRRFRGYVPFGAYNDLEKIIQKGIFFPTFVSGLSGNGKTLMVEQICADNQRECIRVNISIDTDQTDLVGGPTLVNGNVVWNDGPALVAMKKGSIFLLDEVDRGSNKLLCLQGIMEGKPYYNKFTNEVIYPTAGFNIIATANTKGKGSEDGRFLAEILDDAFLERFAIAIDQEYPPEATELQIIINEMKKQGCLDRDFATLLVSWSQNIRQLYESGGINELVSTRRLSFVVAGYAIYGNRSKAIEYALNRFDPATRDAMLQYYKAIDAKAKEEKRAKAPNAVREKGRKVDLATNSAEDADPFFTPMPEDEEVDESDTSIKTLMQDIENAVKVFQNVKDNWEMDDVLDPTKWTLKNDR